MSPKPAKSDPLAAPEGEQLTSTTNAVGMTRAGVDSHPEHDRATVWLAENMASLVAYNRFVEEHGVFSDGLRGF
jgi:post-segregation antitoxin (ccd killing protein)